jgi:hypothetical protein
LTKLTADDIAMAGAPGVWEIAALLCRDPEALMPLTLKLPPRRSTLAGIALAPAFGAFAGCGGPGIVDRAQVEQKVRDGLTKSVGEQAPKASCPKDLPAEKGATIRCSMDFPDGRLGISVKVTSVKDGDAKFDIQADQKLQPKS